MRDIQDQARRDGRAERRTQRTDEEQQRQSEERVMEQNKALTVVHMQGPLMLNILGLLLAGLAFIAEIITDKHSSY